MLPFVDARFRVIGHGTDIVENINVMADPALKDLSSNRPAAFFGGAAIGTLGGLIGLGGAEFRLPLLIGSFGFAALEAVILNKAMSLVVVAFALPFRATTVPFDQIAAHWPIIVNLLPGAWLVPGSARAGQRG
ncbi:hypothetical protein IE4771_PB00059 (plasmid) [Rhizobium etli bv. mimosae str. IE4771]|uniref:Uncharacterized protein n=1 Tax=Rhizobium etli bv. mimosae str. IE4771 TaxID=1432050 RepID=A0A060I7R6_RHIET|nr:hypothetical protein IE4771_PB00059 [Rhizobium sp. IE4771]